MSRRPRSLFLGGSSVESLASLDGGKKKKKKKGGLFSRFAASVSSLAAPSSGGGRRDAAAQTPPPPDRAHKHTQTGEDEGGIQPPADNAPLSADPEEEEPEDDPRPESPLPLQGDDELPVLPFVAPLPPALRTDSPLRHSPKSVHFDDEPPPLPGASQDEGLTRPDDDWPPPPPPADLEGLEDLLRNLDILGRPESNDDDTSAHLFPADVGGGPVDLELPTDPPLLLPSPPAFFFSRDMSSTRDGQRRSSAGEPPENDAFEFHPPPVTYSQQKSHPTNGHTPEGGAVLLEERVTRGEDGAVVRERVFGLPLRETGREEVRTARFVPAPPKYEGIGPTDPDGLPLAPRQMVQKEHDWYKSMFKTLHPADDAYDEHPVVVRYGSSPEPEKSTEKPERGRAHPSLLRIEHAFPSPLNDTAPPPPPPSQVDQQLQGGGGQRRPRATALFPFRAMHENELPLSKGDVVAVSRRVDANWLEGEHRGRRGIFPANHVKVLFPDQAMCGRVLHDFQAQSPLELTVDKDEVVRVERCSPDADWWAVRGERGRGLVPAARLRLIEGPEDQEEEEVRRNKNTLIEPLMCVALYPYAPAHPDELELRAGDRVCVVERCGDGWCAGTCARTRDTGLFPGNYVEPIHEN